jgi:hypothetical protein
MAMPPPNDRRPGRIPGADNDPRSRRRYQRTASSRVAHIIKDTGLTVADFLCGCSPPEPRSRKEATNA